MYVKLVSTLDACMAGIRDPYSSPTPYVPCCLRASGAVVVVYEGWHILETDKLGSRNLLVLGSLRVRWDSKNSWLRSIGKYIYLSLFGLFVVRWLQQLTYQLWRLQWHSPPPASCPYRIPSKLITWPTSRTETMSGASSTISREAASSSIPAAHHHLSKG